MGGVNEACVRPTQVGLEQTGSGIMGDGNKSSIFWEMGRGQRVATLSVKTSGGNIPVTVTRAFVRLYLCGRELMSFLLFNSYIFRKLIFVRLIFC